MSSISIKLISHYFIILTKSVDLSTSSSLESLESLEDESEDESEAELPLSTSYLLLSFVVDYLLSTIVT